LAEKLSPIIKGIICVEPLTLKPSAFKALRKKSACFKSAILRWGSPFTKSIAAILTAAIAAGRAVE